MNMHMALKQALAMYVFWNVDVRCARRFPSVIEFTVKMRHMVARAVQCGSVAKFRSSEQIVRESSIGCN